MLAHSARTVREVQRKLLGRLPDWLRRYVIALAALTSASGFTVLLIHTVGTKASLLYGLIYFVVIGGAAWLGYGPGLLVCTITTYLLPPLLLGRPPHVDPGRFGLLLVISLLISRISTSTRRTEASLRRAAQDLAKQSEELAKSQQTNEAQARLLQCILDSMGDGVIVADQNGKFLLFNPAAEKILGVGALDTLPESWADKYGLFLPDTTTPYPAHDMPLARAIRGDTVSNAEIFVKHDTCRDGVWINVTAQPLRENRGVLGGVAVLRDVSEAKQAQEALLLARKDAEQASHAKSEFLSRMSHELRTPLNAILGFAQLLEIDSLNAPQRQSVDQILKGGRHLLTLINEVLDLARIEAGKLALSTEPIRIGEATQAAVDLVGQLATHHHVELRTEPSPLWNEFVLADRQRLQQVILNLLSNAIKYNRPGGSVTVACQMADTDRCRLQVRDTGCGLSPEKLNYLFTPFDRLGAEVSEIEGTGIGLALSKRLVEAMSGKIGVETESGEGSTFWVELPRVESPLDSYERQRPEDESAELFMGDSRPYATVLYIEDNVSNTLLMERIFENRPGVRLISTMQGRLGVELARQHVPDLILLDLHLPDLPGNEVLRQLQASARTSDIPVAMISADATPNQIDRLLAAGARTYLTKPLDVRRLLQFVDEALGVHAEQLTR